MFNTTRNSNENHQRSLHNNKNGRRRLILKDGKCNILTPQALRKKFTFLQFTALVGASWLSTFYIFVITLIASWLFFAVVWWLICYTHGDFQINHLPPVQKQNNFTPCVYYMYNFASCLLFSIETQHTVGYGVKATTNECPEAIFVNTLQCIIGYIMQGFMAVIIFSKMTLPKLRSKTLLFSKVAAISLKNNDLCFMFRIGDLRKNHIIDANVRAFFIKTERTIEGEILEHRQTDLPLQIDNCRTGLFFNWPLIVFHKIDNKSPLYQFSPSDVLLDFFEIIVLLEGTMESTGQITQARTSYISSEIFWGKKFQNMINFNNDIKQYEADFSKFDNTDHVSTPLCSAAYLEEFKTKSSLCD